MALSLPVPDSSNSIQEVTLDGINYKIHYKFNSRDSAWRLNIFRGSTQVIVGEKVMVHQLLLGRYQLSDFNHGDIICFRVKDDNLPLGRDNFGVDKAYQLIYFTTEEIAAL